MCEEISGVPANNGCGLSTLGYNVLLRGGYHTSDEITSDIRKRGLAALFRIKGCGRKAVKDIMDALDIIGIQKVCTVYKASWRDGDGEFPKKEANFTIQFND
jgi:hypothetical protein